MLLEKILQQPVDSPRLHLQDAVYGAGGQTLLLQHVLGLANANDTGPRHIVFGVHRDEDNALQFTRLADSALKELDGYAELVARYLEPNLRVEPIYGDVQGNVIAALEISQCNNPPYMVKTDAGRDLRRGDCWVRENGLFRPAQRADIDRMYRYTAQNAPKRTSNNIVCIGFNDDPMQTRLSLVLPDVSHPPSSLVAQKMHHEIRARKDAKSNNIEDTGLARLVHARLYGSERPFQDQGLSTLVEGYNAVLERNKDADNYYFFEQRAVKLNLSVINTGHEPLEDVSILLMLPWAKQFRVAEHLYGPPGKQLTLKESMLMGYPQVKHYKGAVHVKQEIESLQPDESLQLFEQALRVAVLPELTGRKVALSYSVQAKGLDRPEEGRLRLQFAPKGG